MHQLQRPEQSDIQQCLYVDWYKFKQCGVTSCKNHTTRTAHCCLAVDRVQPTGNKIISDSEIHYYKFDKDNVSTKYVSLKRKEATTRVHALLVLRSLIEFIKEKYGKQTYKEPYIHKRLVKRENTYPLKIEQLQFERWMWPYLFSKKVFSKFSKGKAGELRELQLHDLLSVDKKTFLKLLTTIKEIRNGTKSSVSNNSSIRAKQEQQRMGSQ